MPYKPLETMSRPAVCFWLCLCTMLLIGCTDTSQSNTAESSTASTAAAASTASADSDGSQTIVLGGGCFWCVEAVFEELGGVSSVVSGYAGGKTKNPTYKQVCADTTGHAEVCEIRFDPSVVSVNDLLDAFFATHDPTTLNRQGYDRGSQYRSTILYTSDEQKLAAEQYIAKLDKQQKYGSPVVTTVEPLTTFYAAEKEHQDYYLKNPGSGYCVQIIPSKLEKLRDLLARKSENETMPESNDSTPEESKSEESVQERDTPEKVTDAEPQVKVITLGGGCFWCVEAVFEEMEGVTDAISGYAGGHVDNPTYEAVCQDTTGHAEVCEIHYDENKVQLGELLEVFFKTHDPTSLNRQGADRGTQYRSTIMYHDDEQKQIAEKYIKKLDDSGKLGKKIVTELVAAPKFYEAEQYHQDYFRKNPGAGYCVAVVAPKVLKFRDVFPEKRKKSE